MKKIFLLLSIAFFVSCKKDNEVMRLQKDIIGTWELRQFTGFPFNQPPLPPGNGKIIVLKGDGSFERKQQDSLLFIGTYNLQKKKDCSERDTDIIFSTNEGSFDNYQYVQMIEGELTLSTPNCYQDGGTAYYRKLK